MTFFKRNLFFILLAAAVFAVFGKAVFYTEMLLDDIIYVQRYHLLTFSLENLKIWQQPILGLWGPLTAYSFMLDFLIWGKEYLFPGAHLMNILLHFLAACAFYTGARLLKFSRFAAGAAVLFWALHPQRAESVAWLCERKDVLLLALGLWSIVLFIKAIKEKRRGYYALSLLFFLLSFCIKPALIGLPLVLTAYLWGRYRKKDPVFYLCRTGPFWLLSLLYYIGFKLVTDGGNMTGAAGISDQITLIGWRYGNYLVKTFIPLGLTPMYPHFSVAADSLLPLYAAGAVILLLLFFLYKGSQKALYIWLPCFLAWSAAVAPGLFRIGDVDFADRYSYFPSVFAVLAAASLLCTLVKKYPQTRKPVIFLACLLPALMAILCFQELDVWKNKDTYTAAALAVRRPHYRCLIEEAVICFDKGDFEGAGRYIEQLRSGSRDVPEISKLTIGLFIDSIEGAMLVRSGKTAAGMKKVIQVLSHPRWDLLKNTTYGYPRFILLLAAGFFQKNGNRQAAAEMYRRIAGIYASFEPLEKEFYLALAALCLDDRNTALKHFEEALKFNPDDENIRKNIEALRRQAK